MVSRHSVLIACCSGALFTAAILTSAKPQDPIDQTYKTKVQPLLKKYCVSCHSGPNPDGHMSLDKGVSAQQVVKNQRQWERLLFNVKSQSMPPGGVKPTDAERQTIIEWVQAALSSNCDLADAGKVTIRRLNRTEYDNTIRDLLGVDLKLSSEFPSDDVGEGFDNIGEVLTVSPLLLEKYLAAAEKAATAAIKLKEYPSYQVDFDWVERASGVNLTDNGAIGFFTVGTASINFKALTSGEHVLTIEAYQQKAGPEDAKLGVTIDGRAQESFTVTGQLGKPTPIQIPFEAAAGDHKIVVSFLNDYYNRDGVDASKRDRNLFVQHIEVKRPIGTIQLPNGPITSLPTGDTDLETPKGILTKFASRAYRRAVKPQEVERLIGMYSKLRKAGASYEQAMRDCIAATLTSPNFLFREESKPVKGGLGSNDIASRLSYFLWASTPDDTLLQLAGQDKLTDPKVVDAQVTRMLASPKAKSLGADFAIQWLQLRKLETVSPDPTLFPEFNDDLRHDMVREAELNFNDVLQTNRSVLDLVDSKSTFLNERLAKLYGFSGVTGDTFRKVEFKDLSRGGLLGMAAVLTVTSNPNRTSPVKRGKWVLENLLGSAPPPPMPDVGILIDDTAIIPTLPMKERLQMHRKKPECSTCHLSMDAMGFSLENFDPIGRWRTKDGDFTVDSTSTLPDGKQITGSADLRKLILERKKDFVRCLAEKLLTYAIGRGLRPQDACHVTTIVQATEKDGFKMQALIKAVVMSDPFRKAAE